MVLRAQTVQGIEPSGGKGPEEAGMTHGMARYAQSGADHIHAKVINNAGDGCFVHAVKMLINLAYVKTTFSRRAK